MSFGFANIRFGPISGGGGGGRSRVHSEDHTQNDFSLSLLFPKLHMHILSLDFGLLRPSRFCSGGYRVLVRYALVGALRRHGNVDSGVL
jgi:hypothetical protein